MTLSAFFMVHQDLPREGPGSPEDVLWALKVAGTPANARILDAGCGPGADTVTLAQESLSHQVLAVDLHQPFIEQARVATSRFGQRVRAEVNCYLNIEGPFDLIWCAGAAYFHGVVHTLANWLPDLAQDGCVAFSEPVRVTDPATPEVLAFWEDYAPLRSVSEMERELKSADWEVLGHRLLIGAPWAAYYDPMRVRLEMLRAGSPDDALQKAIKKAASEITQWEALKDQIAYALFVVRPT